MASTAFLTQGTVVNIGTTAGGAKTISGVAVGSPTLLTATAHGFSNGDVVTLAALTGSDAALLNTLSFVVLYKTANTFAVDVDTTGKTITAGAGTATPLAWQTIRNVRGTVTWMDGQAKEIDVTNLQSSAIEIILGLMDSGSCKFEVDIDDSDLGQQALLSAQQASAKKTFKITMSEGSTPNFTFTGFVRSFGRSGAPNDVFKGGVDIRITAPVVLS